MKKFELKNFCSKCGYLFKDAFVEYKVGIFHHVDQENTSITSFGKGPNGYLLRTCQRCGYKWPEMTIDKHL